MLEFIIGALVGITAAVGVISVRAYMSLRKQENASERLIIRDTDDEDERLFKLNKQWQNLMDYTGVKQDD